MHRRDSTFAGFEVLFVAPASRRLFCKHANDSKYAQLGGAAEQASLAFSQMLKSP